MYLEGWIRKTICKQKYYESIDEEDGSLLLTPYVVVNRYVREGVTDKKGDVIHGEWIPADHPKVPDQICDVPEERINCTIAEVSIMLKYNLRPDEPSPTYRIFRRDNSHIGVACPSLPGYFDSEITWLRTIQLNMVDSHVVQKCMISGLTIDRVGDPQMDRMCKLYEGKVYVYFNPSAKEPDEYWKLEYCVPMKVTSGQYYGDNPSGDIINRIDGIDNYIHKKTSIIDQILRSNNKFTAIKDKVVGFIYGGRGYHSPSINADGPDFVSGKAIDGVGLFLPSGNASGRFSVDLHKHRISLMYEHTLYAVRDKLYLNGCRVGGDHMGLNNMTINELELSLRTYLSKGRSADALVACLINKSLPDVRCIEVIKSPAVQMAPAPRQYYVNDVRIDILEERDRTDGFKKELAFIQNGD